MALVHPSTQIQSMVKINLDAIKRLSVQERVRLVQDTWDTLQPTASELPVTEEQRALVHERLVEYRRNPDATIPWSEVRSEFGLD